MCIASGKPVDETGFHNTQNGFGAGCSAAWAVTSLSWFSGV